MKKIFLLSALLIFCFSSYAQRWTYKTLNENKLNMDVATIGNKVFFYSGTKYIGGSSLLVTEVEIFDLEKDTREIVTLTGGSVRSGCATATLGSKVYFAGGVGYPETGGTSKQIDIYDTLTDLWSTDQLALPRSELAAAAAYGKIIFGGGYNFGVRRPVDNVDIYNSVTDTWTSTFFNGYPFTTINQRRNYLTAVSLGNKVFFAGGIYSLSSNKVNIYDALQNKWLPEAQLSQPKSAPSSVTYKNKAYFMGGSVRKIGPVHDIIYPADTIDIYDNETGSWSVMQIPRFTITSAGVKRGIAQVATAGCKVFMVPALNGWSGPTYAPMPGTEDTITVYDFVRDAWSYITLPHKRTGVTIASAGNKVLFAGGIDFLFPGADQNHIDILTVDPNLQLMVTNGSTEGFDFGDVPLESSSNAAVKISNEGDYDLLFAALGGRISMTGDIDDFKFNEDDLKLVDTLSPAQQLTLPVTFHPTTSGFKQVVISVHSNDPDQPEYFFTLQGNGSTTTAINEPTANKTIECYPNPTNGKVTIQSGFQLPYHLQIINLLGYITSEEEIKENNQEINLSHLPQGLYYLKVSEANKNAVIPLLKK